MWVEERTVELAKSNAELKKEVAERKQVEEVLSSQQAFLKAVLENIEDGIVACDEKGMLSFFNRATRNFHGISAEHLPPEQWAAHYDLCLADGKTPMPTEDIPLFRAFQNEHVKNIEMVIAPSKGGRPRTLLASGNAMIDEAGKKIGAVVSMHDITERKQDEEELNRQNTELEASNKELESYSYSIAHDLRTPLRAITSFSQILMEDAQDQLDAEQLQYLTRIVTAGNNMAQLIDDILELSRKHAVNYTMKM